MTDARLVQSEALDALRGMESASIDAVITDPPYFLPAAHYSVRRESFRSLADLSILEHFFRDVFTEAARVLKPTGVLYAFCDGQSYPPFYAVAYPFFRRVRPLVWDKQTSINGYAWRHQHELIMYAEKADAPKVPTGDGDILTDRAVPIDDREHLAQKPIPLLRKLVRKTHIGGVVLDPFMGSGSTGIAAAIEGRDFIGVELNPEYFALAQERIEAARIGYRSDGHQMVLGVEDGAA